MVCAIRTLTLSTPSSRERRAPSGNICDGGKQFFTEIMELHSPRVFCIPWHLSTVTCLPPNSSEVLSISWMRVSTIPQQQQ